MQCCLSQKAPLEPVVARTSGCLFEKSLIERYIEEHGRCPITGEPLSKEDLLPVRPATPTAVVAGGTTSIPGLLKHLHVEWEAMALEQFTLRQQLAQSQQELAHALQQYEAACVVIARVTEERDAALRGGTAGRGHPHKVGPAAAAEEEEGAAADRLAVPAALAEAMDDHEAARRQQRKAAKQQREAITTFTTEQGANLAKVGAPKSFRVGGAHSTALTVSCAPASSALYAAGSGENQVLRYDLATHAITHRGVGHTGAVHAVRALSSSTSSLVGGAEVFSASADRTVRLWQASATEALTCTATLRYTHSLSAVAREFLCAHYVLAAGEKTVSLTDLATGAHVAVGTVELGDEGSNSAIVSAELHPYGALAGLGSTTGELLLFDVRHMSVDTVIPMASLTQPSALAVQSIAFHADCLTVATGMASGAVALWDLRHVEAPVALLPAPAKAAHVPLVVSFEGEHSAFLAVAGASLSVYETESFRAEAAEAKPLFAHPSKTPYKDVSWGPGADYLAACTMGGVVEIFECV